MNGVLDRRKNTPLHKSEEPSHTPQSDHDFILRKKIQIKTQALLILSQELDQCRMQRDRFKLMAEQLQEDLNKRKHPGETSTKIMNGYRLPPFHNAVQKSTIIDSLEEDKKLIDLLIEAKEENKCLRLQVDTMKHQLKETQADIKALRSRKASDSKPVNEVTSTMSEREELLQQLEKLNIKCVQLKVDLQSVIDEKQELELEKDAFKCKAHRLNHELSQALSASQPVDVDALVNENRYLQERLQQLLEEKNLAQQSVQKYKGMLDSKRQKGTIKLGGKSAVGSIMNLKQVEQLLRQGPNIPPQKSAAALSELHSICTALLESLNDKNTALAHQKKVNKMLATRMCELDKTVQSPTAKLLEGYSSAEVDIKCDSISMVSDLSEEKSESRESDLQLYEGTTNQSIKAKEIEESHTEPNVEDIDCTSSVAKDDCTFSVTNNDCISTVTNKTENEHSETVGDSNARSNISISAGCKSPCNLRVDEKLNFTEFEIEMNAELPDDLKALVQKYLVGFQNDDEGRC